ncbi:SAM-dependent methyltransferase [Methylophilaceae bacterium]|nr:SAM-dependent methyltransferase [bacterium]MDC0931359.1 SAM-dependent methyltransferase [Methylophilaceae bacterium]
MEINTKNHGELFLIPTSIEQEFNNNFLLEADKKKLKKIKNFIVENPKTARKALKKLNLDESLQDLNIMEHSKKSSFKSIEDYLKPIFNGESLGLLSDSGTPCIADPGAKIVSKAHEFNIKVIPLVGPSSIILSLMASGFNGQNFCFHGYVPIEENKKTNFFKEIQININKKQETQIFIETPYRNNKLLTDIMKIDNDSLKLCVATNLTDTNQTISSKTIKQWHQNKIPDLSKKLCIFLLN